MRVLAAMSGGVDSAVAAARAVDAGHDVVGVHLALSRAGGTLRAGSRGCCTIEDAMDARRAADLLGIPFYVWDFSERFRDDVIDDFVSEYRAGRTPNPCMRCNEKIKFAALLERAIELGFDAVCTGHYALLVDGPEGRELHRASDAAKDQSYVLGVLTAEQLAHTYFPLGSTPSKAEVRAEAAERGLTVAQKPDSHDICFIPDGDTRGWLAEKVGAEAGEIVDRTGAVVGRHEGAHAFTVGQRRGLQLGVPAPDGKPRFVLEVRPVDNRVVVGPKEALATAEIAGGRFTWAGRAPSERVFACDAQIRAHADPVPARAEITENEIVVIPDTPFDGVAPGQTAVIYEGSRVLGQFTIDRTVSAVPVDA
ncbi:tRNA(5-methylaminomethyl-2-thiouridine)-methyltransferase [Microbacterium sp. AISO3]|uniref:tRNA-specific 2-thiouridylase MnmA n=2 Tax=Microbacterium TaxID=33882 RepID=A0ABU1HY18_9MICO|nr:MULTISPECIES: tRNA 2-thiouridine(34) synthase MnmA [Microbacterium]MDR6166305.1 tRNA-specific 2-thiouridylase [Microbacterium paludicola]OWP22829.1 tRNA(5-methylaminomethyl-2-thiouridine)-methyltransferase [Microbacterium sp. AISO3]POX67046.1 tRNA 2-thiouridine(34) synthase MnmA [Microbacterium sp. Ru50]QCR40336.1 tRNA 2-thiouridine(34) synthase MnmA [Microbacterium sp. SGAir0570]GAD33047.1 tRNA(5-methylaminomethyl-2-thiouridylate) methyltransferase [Microbacterium sp. TS-1]